jgi:hypothetical protein
MKNRSIHILLLLGWLVLFQSCNSSAEKVDIESSIEEDYYEFKALNLASHQLNATILVPDETANIGASTVPEIKHELDGFKWEITVGPNFHLIIEDFGDNKKMVQVEKNRIADLSMFEVNYFIDSEDLILYELTLLVDGDKSAPKSVGLEHHSYHVYGQTIIDGFTYVFRSRDEGYEKRIIDLMAKTIRSVKENK